MDSFTLLELAELVGGEVSGDENLVVRGLNSIEQAGASEITFIIDVKMAAALHGKKAAACIVPLELTDELEIPVIRARHPDVAETLTHNHLLI